MRTRTSIRLTVAAALAAAISITPLLAQRGPGEGLRGPMGGGMGMAAPDAPGEGRHLGPLGRCLQVIDLSDTQRADIRALLESEAPTLRSLREQMRTDREALKAALDAETPDACAVGAAMLKVHEDREAVQSAVAAVRTKIAALLTEEQKLKLEGCLAGMQHGRR